MSAATGLLGGVAGLFSIGTTLEAGQVQAAGAEYTAQAQEQMYNYQSQVATINAQIAKQNASYDIMAGEVQAQASGMATAQEVGETKAQQGAGNLDVNTGSAVAVRSSEEAVGAENQALIRANAAKAAYGEDVSAFQYTAQSTLDTAAGQEALGAGQYQAQASILGSVASASSKFASLATGGGLSGITSLLPTG